METKNIEQYYSSLAPIQAMHGKGIISDSDFNKAEDLLAKKYCIKKSSIYRANRLINKSFRAIYVVPKKEVQNGTETNNENRCVTEITKEN